MVSFEIFGTIIFYFFNWDIVNNIEYVLYNFKLKIILKWIIKLFIIFFKSKVEEIFFLLKMDIFGIK